MQDGAQEDTSPRLESSPGEEPSVQDHEMQPGVQEDTLRLESSPKAPLQPGVPEATPPTLESRPSTPPSVRDHETQPGVQEDTLCPEPSPKAPPSVQDHEMQPGVKVDTPRLESSPKTPPCVQQPGVPEAPWLESRPSTPPSVRDHEMQPGVEEDTPPWLESAVAHLADSMLRERHAGAGARSRRRPTRRTLAVLAMSAAALIVALTVRGASPPTTAIVTPSDAGVQLASSGGGWPSAASLATLVETLRDTTSRGDSAVRDAARYEAALRLAEARLREGALPPRRYAVCVACPKAIVFPRLAAPPIILVLPPPSALLTLLQY